MTDDERIIQLFFARSEDAMREVDLKYGKICHRLSCNILNDRQDAEECVNDAYLGLWNAVPPSRPDPLLPYLCKIVRNLSLKRYRQKRAARRSGPFASSEASYRISSIRPRAVCTVSSVSADTF